MKDKSSDFVLSIRATFSLFARIKIYSSDIEKKKWLKAKKHAGAKKTVNVVIGLGTSQLFADKRRVQWLLAG